MRYCKLRYVVQNWKYLQKCKKIKVKKKPIFAKNFVKKDCQILAVEFFSFNPNKCDVWNPCQVQGGWLPPPHQKSIVTCPN